MTDRRRFLTVGLLSLVPSRLMSAQDEAQDADSLRTPWTVGQNRSEVTDLDRDPAIIAVERRLRCTCGCTLDVYTCRTTDFTCTFSPEIHREILAMYAEGKSPVDIVAFYVAREGEAVLMAPPAEGFNLVGYLVPGLAMMSGVVALAAWLTRRRRAVVAAEAPVQATIAAPDDAQRERLRRALDDVDA